MWCPCKWMKPACVKEAEQEELRRKLYRHRRRRSTQRRQEERRRQEAQREEEREKERSREKVLLHQQFRHLYRSDRLTSTSRSTLDASISTGSRSSFHPSQDILSIFSDTQTPQDVSPERCQGAASVQDPEEGEAGCRSVFRCDESCSQQEIDGRYGASKWVSCLPRVEEEGTDEAEHEAEDKEEETGDSYFPPPPRPLSLLAPNPDRLTHLQGLRDGGQRFSMMSYTDWLRDGVLKSSVPSHIHSLTSLRRARSEPKLPQASSRGRMLTRSHEAQSLQQNQAPSTSKARHGKRKSKDSKEDIVAKEGGGWQKERSTGESSRCNRVAVTTGKHRDARARRADEAKTGKDRSARLKATKRNKKIKEKGRLHSTTSSTSSALDTSATCPHAEGQGKGVSPTCGLCYLANLWSN